MLRTHYTKDLEPEQKVTIAGWVRKIRDLGNIKFLIIHDRYGSIQVIAKKGEVNDEIFMRIEKELTKESVVRIKGDVKENKQAPTGIEITPDKIELLARAERTLPLEVSEKSKADLSTRLDARYLDLRKPSIAAIFKIRDVLLTGARDHFEGNKFIEIHTPNIISTASEGGTELFPISYFEKEAFLSQSPQLYKQMMMATGLDKVYEVARYFRAEEHKTIWHINEITGLDCEMAFIESEEDVMEFLEVLIVNILKHIKNNAQEELKILGKKVNIPKYPFPRVSYREAVNLIDVDVPENEDLSTKAEKNLGQVMKEKGYKWYFITKYPIAIKPFYTMPEGNLSRAFDLDYKGREIVSGSQRIHQPELLVDQIKSNGINPQQMESYLQAFKYGMPPHGGFGLGVGRLLMLLLDLPNIREAVLFPRDKTRLAP